MIDSIPRHHFRLATAEVLKVACRQWLQNARVLGMATDLAIDPATREGDLHVDLDSLRNIVQRSCSMSVSSVSSSFGSGAPSGNLRSKRRMAVMTSDFAMMRVNFPLGNPLNSASSSNHSTIVSRFCRQPSGPQSFIVSARVSHLHESLGRANHASIFLSSFPGPGRKSLIRKLTGSSPVGMYSFINWRSSAMGLPSRFR